MMYAASSRRSTVRLQRQASSRAESRRSSVVARPTSAASSAAAAARPNTANSYKQAGRPSTPYKTDRAELLGNIQRTFMLNDEEMQRFHRAFCYMAKHQATEPMTSTKAKERKGVNKSGKASTAVPKPLPRPWEVGDSSKVTLSISDFFATFHLTRSAKNGGFLDALFDLVGTKDLHAMTYGEFLDAICTFSMFKLEDLIRFVFFVLDKDKRGRVARTQLLRFVESIHGKKILAFVHVILPDDSTPTRSKDNAVRLPSAEMHRASVDYPALKKLCTEYPSMLEPLLLLQTDIRRRIMGDAWWKRKEMTIDTYYRTLDQRNERKRRKEEKRLLRERKGKIKAEIGLFAYYRRGRSRSDMEKEYPKPIVSLKADTGDVCVEWTRIDGKDGYDDNGSVQTG